MSPQFIEFDEALEIHAVMIDRFGGDPSTRDAGLLSSALAQPRATFGGAFLHADIFEMAAAYLFHIVQNHPFVDGNKRTGAATAITFLELNGVDVSVPRANLLQLVLEVAQGRIGKRQIAEFFRDKSE